MTNPQKTMIALGKKRLWKTEKESTGQAVEEENFSQITENYFDTDLICQLKIKS